MPPDDDVTRFRNPVLDADWPDPDAVVGPFTLEVTP